MVGCFFVWKKPLCESSAAVIDADGDDQNHQANEELVYRAVAELLIQLAAHNAACNHQR